MTGADREYFYVVDREGGLRHDGTLLRDAAFLWQFYRRLERNGTGRHLDHPFVSACGTELNFVRPEATAVVFRRLVNGELEYGPGLAVPFDPAALAVGRDGCLYHRAPVGGFGLLRPALAVGLAESIEERGGGHVYVAGPKAYPIRVLDR